MGLAARILIFIPLILLFYLLGRFLIFDIIHLDSLLYQSLLEIIYLIISALVSLILSAIIVDKLKNNRN